MIKSHLKRVLIGCTLGLSAAVVFWRTSPRIYEASTQVYINTNTGRANDTMAALLAMGAAQSEITEASILKSYGTFGVAAGNIGQAMPSSGLVTQEAIDDLYMMYDVEMVSESKVMTVKVKAYSPEVAARLANEIVSVYNEKRHASSDDSNGKAQKSINSQLVKSKKDLDRTELALKNFREKTGMMELGTAATQISGYQATLTQQRDSVSSEIESLTRSIASEKAKIDSLPVTVAMNLNAVRNPILDAIEMDIANYEKQRTELLRLYTPTSIKIKEIDAQIERTKARQLEAQKNLWKQTTRTSQIEPIRAGLEQQLAQDTIKLVSLNARLRSTDKALAAQKAVAATLPAKERQLSELTRDLGIFQNNYQRLKAQLTELKLQSAAPGTSADILYAAVPPKSPVSPQPGKILPLGLLAGAVLALLYGFLRDSLRSTARSSEEISSLFELPVVATVPVLPDMVVRRKLSAMTERNHVPQESFRFMASAAALAQGGPRSVVFTSSGGNVGCSSAAGEFAVAAAKMGVKTILIDGDTTFGTITKAFKMTEKSGLRDLLGRKLLATEEMPLAHETDHTHLLVLPIGTDKSVEISDTPNALLKGLIESLHEQADLIVVDCPPIDVMADTSRFVAIASEVCLVVSARKTNLQAISLARMLLERCGAAVVSVVLTGATPKDEAFTPNNRYMAARR